MATPRLSVCLIARNEAANIKRCLASVRTVADEILLTDTGSTDDTIAVAECCGASVAHFAWCDDFSAARNHAITRATGDWILWLDADEELVADTVPALAAELADDSTFAYQLARRDLKLPDRLDYYALGLHTRLWRRLPEIRFIGRCHPHYDPPLHEFAAPRGQQIRRSRVEINHYGYIGADLKQQKSDRGLRLLQLELEDRPDQIYYLVELGLTQLQHGNRAGRDTLYHAAKLLRRHIDNPHAPTTPVVMLLTYMLQLGDQAMPPEWKRGEVETLAQRWFPDAPPVIWLFALRDYQAGRFERAAARLERLLQMGADHSYDARVSFDPCILGDDARVNLGVCLIRLGRLDDAEAILRQVDRKGDKAQAARDNLKQVQMLRAAR